MPFLFVDYDQGAGGEYLTYILSQSLQCNSLDGFKTSTGRHKVNDVFHQEFLKSTPTPTVVQSHSTLYDVVPCHRQTALARSLLTDVKTLRIKNPQDELLWTYLSQQRTDKVLLSREPNYEMFAGQVKMLQQSAVNPNFLSMIDHKMDVLTLRLIAGNIEPTEENKQKYLKIFNAKQTEPKEDYNLIVPYEKLLQDPSWVKDNILTAFGIDVDLDLLTVYKTNYENAQHS